jgi:hypothetical protein
VKYDGPVEVDAGAILLNGPVNSACRMRLSNASHQRTGRCPKGIWRAASPWRRRLCSEVHGDRGAIAYILDGRAKSATFFYFRRDSDSPEHDDLDGVGGVEWLTFDEARARASRHRDLCARAVRLELPTSKAG